MKNTPKDWRSDAGKEGGRIRALRLKPEERKAISSMGGKASAVARQKKKAYQVELLREARKLADELYGDPYADLH